MRFQCPICKDLLLVEDSEMGSAVQCGHCGIGVNVPSSRTAPGCVIGDFIILHELGRGGMGIVYDAHQISLDRPAALKILADSYARNADFVVGFIKEARAAAKLNHPNIVQAYAVGDDNGVFFFAMERIDGETMKKILVREHVIPVEKAVDIVRQIAEALEYAWQEEKLVHRDIKPDNIMLTSNGRAKLADLGLAKVGNDPGKADGEEVMGTPQYISPEQLTGEALDNRTDIYCLGATFYQFLTGRFPYEGATALEIAKQHLEGTLIPPNQINPAIPEEVSLVVEKMMAKEPADRYQSAGQLAEDLNRIKHGQNPLAVGGAPQIVPPKIKVPGGKSSGKGGSRLSLKGTVSTPSVAIPQFTAIPRDAAAPKPAPEPAAPDAADTKKNKKAVAKDASPAAGKKKKILLLAVLIAALAVLALGGWVAYLQFVKKQNAVQYLNTVVSNTRERIQKATAEPEPSAFMKAATPVVELIRKPDASSQEQILRQCYDFLKKQLLPQTEDEKELGIEILDYFARNDEGQVESARERALEAYEAQQQQKRLAAEAAAKKKMEADRIARKREEERKLAEAEQERKRAEKAALEAEKNRKMESFKKRLADWKHQQMLDLFRCIKTHDAESVKRLYENYITYQAFRDAFQKPEWMTDREFSRAIGSHIYAAKMLKKHMEEAWEWEKIFTDGHPVLVGMQLELRRNICHITGIKNGVIYAKSGSKEFSEPVKNLVNNKRFLRVACDAAAKLDKKDTLAYYFFWMGAFRSAYQAALEGQNKERWRYSAFANNLLKELWKEPQMKSEVEKYFRGVPEYDKMNPRRGSSSPVQRKNPRNRKK